MRVISARVSAIVHATEDREKVIRALNEICSLELSPSIIEQTTVRGHFGNPIVSLNVGLQGTQAEEVLASVWRKLSGPERDLIVEGLADMLDDSGRLHLRLDKQEGFCGRARLNVRDSIKVQFSLQRRLTHAEVGSLLESLFR